MLHRQQRHPCTKFCKLCLTVALPTLIRIVFKFAVVFFLIPSFVVYGAYTVLPDFRHSETLAQARNVYSQLTHLSHVIMTGSRPPGETIADVDGSFFRQHFGVKLESPRDIFAKKLYLEVARDQQAKAERIERTLGRVREKRSRARTHFSPVSHSELDKYCLEWYGPFNMQSGFTEEATEFVLALDKLMPRQVKPISFGGSFEGLMGRNVFEMQHRACHSTEHVISMCHCLSHNWYKTLGRAKCPPDNAKYTIGRTMIESSLKDATMETFVMLANSRMDEIWVPTRYMAGIFENMGVAPDKIIVIPESVDETFFDPMIHETVQMSHDPTAFVFLSIFKWEHRKGWDVLLNAFVREFSADESVDLVILTHPYDALDPIRAYAQFLGDLLNITYDEDFVEIDDESVKIRTHPRVTIYPKLLNASAIASAYKSSHAFVLPTRGEGWGRPIVEALTMELPTIASYFSGPTEFLTEQNSYPLECPELNGMCEPSLPHLRQLMRHVYENRRPGSHDFAALKKHADHENEDERERENRSMHKDADRATVVDVKRARQDIVSRFSRAIVADRIYHHLRNVSARLAASEGG